jgi:hypothetical protein
MVKSLGSEKVKKKFVFVISAIPPWLVPKK